MTLVAAKLTEDLPRQWIGKQALCLLFMYYSSVETSWFDIWVLFFFFFFPSGTGLEMYFDNCIQWFLCALTFTYILVACELLSVDLTARDNNLGPSQGMQMCYSSCFANVVKPQSVRLDLQEA